MPDEWVARLAVAGTPDQAKARIRALGDAGVTSSVLFPVGDDPWAALERLGAVV
jgi:5,10-methylenetetrahydromethanopterin reductase